MFVVAARFDVTPADAPAFRAALRRNALATLAAEPGCLRFDVASAIETPGRTLLYEVYSDAAAFEAHRNRDHFKECFDVAGPMIRDRLIETFELLPLKED